MRRAVDSRTDIQPAGPGEFRSPNWPSRVARNKRQLQTQVRRNGAAQVVKVGQASSLPIKAYQRKPSRASGSRMPALLLRACLKIVFWVEQATGLLRRATSPPGLLAAGCRQTRAGSPFHPFFRQALRNSFPQVWGYRFTKR